MSKFLSKAPKFLSKAPKFLSEAKDLCVVAALVLLGCGIEVGNPKKPKDEQKPAALIDDLSAETDLVSAQADEIIASVAEQLRATTLGSIRRMTSTPTLTCTERSDGAAIVEAKLTGDSSHTAQRHGHTVTFTSTDNDDTTFTWAQTDQTLKCDATTNNAAIDWTKANALDLQAVVSINRAITMMRQRTDGTTFTRTGQMTISGDRHATWTVDHDASTTDTLILQETATSNINKTFTATRLNGDKMQLETNIAATADNPLKITVTRDATNQAWKGKTITSGVIVMKRSNEFRLEAHIDSVAFGADSGCAPISGSISGDMFKGSDAQAAHHYKIDFNSDGASITIDSNPPAQYEPMSCDMDTNS